MSTIALARPVPGYTGETSSLTLRVPTGADIVACGMPFHIRADGDGAGPVFEAGACARMISTLAVVPLLAIDRLSASEWNTCAWAIVDEFFAPDEAAPVTLREPTGSDIARCSVPFNTTTDRDGQTSSNLKPAACREMLARLSGLKPEEIDTWPANVWYRAALRLTGFFAAGTASNASTPITTAPAGGAT
jgi:hypothetical protein